MKRLKLVPDETKINFLGRRNIAVAISSVLAALSVVLLLATGLNFGIDFRGGALVEARMPGPADLGAVRSVVNDLDVGDVAVQGFGAETDVLIRVEDARADLSAQPEAGAEEGDDASGNIEQRATQRVAAGLQKAFPGVEIRRTEVVGPKVSGELIQRGALAVGLAVLAVLVYIWLRFEWQFAVGAVVALIHDVTLTIGVFAALQLEFNLSIIAAILTIVGYSLNDTVVVFDRVRENLRRYKTTELEEVLNLSINETLSRTLMTSFTTLIALFALYFLGGAVVQGFTFAMIWGVLVGTYSSVFIASPVLVWLGVTREPESADGGPGGATGAGVQFG